MSDRIDELVAICTKQMNACNGCPNLLAITELATIAREAEARAIEKEQKYREADERAWACESVGIPGLEARALEAEAMCEWLAGKVSDRDALAATRDGGSFRSPDDWLAAAREAVKQDER